MKTSGILFFILFGAVSALLISTGIRDWRRKRRIAATLASRVQRDDNQFGRDFFPDAKRADIARRARRVLSKNLRMPLDGLMPSDRLNEDLNSELAANPHLFWELEAEFGIKTGMYDELVGDEDVKKMEKILERLITFQDLVEFVEGRVS